MTEEAALKILIKGEIHYVLSGKVVNVLNVLFEHFLEPTDNVDYRT